VVHNQQVGFRVPPRPPRCALRVWRRTGVTRCHVMADTLLATRLATACWLEGSFTLRSGATATGYFDKYQFEADPSLLREVASQLAAEIPEGTEVLAGLELGGVPVATALSLETGLPVVFVRKVAKAYGTARLVEGPRVSDRQVLVVEDVVTSGGQVVVSTQALRDFGAVVTDAICVLDREESGRENLAAVGVELLPLFRRSDLYGNIRLAEVQDVDSE
jgi:orotate phosphoribosyltransferase